MGIIQHLGRRCTNRFLGRCGRGSTQPIGETGRVDRPNRSGSFDDVGSIRSWENGQISISMGWLCSIRCHRTRVFFRVHDPAFQARTSSSNRSALAFGFNPPCACSNLTRSEIEKGPIFAVIFLSPRNADFRTFSRTLELTRVAIHPRRILCFVETQQCPQEIES